MGPTEFSKIREFASLPNAEPKVKGAYVQELANLIRSMTVPADAPKAPKMETAQAEMGKNTTKKGLGEFIDLCLEPMRSPGNTKATANLGVAVTNLSERMGEVALQSLRNCQDSLREGGQSIREGLAGIGDLARGVLAEMTILTTKKEPTPAAPAAVAVDHAKKPKADKTEGFNFDKLRDKKDLDKALTTHTPTDEEMRGLTSHHLQIMDSGHLEKLDLLKMTKERLNDFLGTDGIGRLSNEKIQDLIAREDGLIHADNLDNLKMLHSLRTSTDENLHKVDFSVKRDPIPVRIFLEGGGADRISSAQARQILGNVPNLSPETIVTLQARARTT